MANIFLGVGIVFGAGATGITGTLVGTFTLQGYDHTKEADTDTVRNENGIEVQMTLYNPTELATFEYTVSAATSAAAITANVIPVPGTIITVTNSTDYTPIAGTTWFVIGSPRNSRSNVGPAKVSLPLKRWTGSGGITAVST